MLLRPATPLAIIFFVAFVLLLLSTLSTPIIHAIPLGSFQGYNFGVFGYCKGTDCSGYKLGYSTDGLFSGDNAHDFELPSSTRHSLSAILIVHPIATFLTLVCFALAIAAHFHSAAHSPRYLLALLIFTIPTLLVTLLAFLVDILLFVPHMQWGGWIVLGATILIIASTVVTCAMRRTLVSRKARKKRIAENADMSGANYYDNLQNNRMLADELPKADSPPPMSGSTAVENKAQFATFEVKKADMGASSADGMAGRRSMDDRTPLNPVRDPSIRSASTGGAGRRPYGMDGDAPPMPMYGRPRMENNDMRGPPRRPSRDQFGNVIPAAAMGGAMGMTAGELRPEESQGFLGSDRSNGYPRGRGGYGQPRGFRGGPQPPGWRGGRGGYRGGQGPPPPGWRGRGGYGPPPPGVMSRGGRAGGYNPPPPGYALDPYYTTSPRSGPPPTIDQQYVQPQPPPQDAFVAGPIGQAIEMDERTGSQPGAAGYGTGAISPTYGLRESDGDVAGMVGLQQERRDSPFRGHGRSEERESGARSPTSVYSDQTYVPVRAQWAQPSPLQHDLRNNTALPMDSSDASAPRPSGEVPSTSALPPFPIQPPPGSPHASPSSRHARGGSDAYYEDVDPRFAIDPPSEVSAASPDDPHHNSGLPSALQPGGTQNLYVGNAGHRMLSPNQMHLRPPAISSHIPSYYGGDASGADEGNGASQPPLDRLTPRQMGAIESDNSNESIPEGARSPGGGSEASNFTSVSQRGVNPNWRPGPGSAGYAAGNSTASTGQRRREDVILGANPDFSLPGMGAGRGRGGRPFSPVRGGPSAMGLTPQGRYPTDI